MPRFRPDPGPPSHCFHLGRQDLLGEVQRNSGHAFVLALGRPLLDPAPELGICGEKMLEQLGRRASRRQGVTASTLALRGSPCRTENSAKKSPLRRYSRSSRAPSARDRSQPALFDDVHRAGRITLAHDDLGCADLHGLERGCDLRETVHGERVELGIEAEEVLHGAEARQPLEGFFDTRVAPGQCLEHVPVEPQRLDRSAGPHRRHARGIADETHLSEAVTSPWGGDERASVRCSACLTTRAVPDTRT